MSFAAGSTYRIRSHTDNQYLGIVGGGTRPFAKVEQNDKRRSDSQVWHLFPADNHLCYLIVNKLSGLNLTVSGDDVSSGRSVIQNDMQGLIGQKWAVSASNDSAHFIYLSNNVELLFLTASLVTGEALIASEANITHELTKCWVLEVVEQLPTVQAAELRIGEAYVGDVDRITHLHSNTAWKTPEILVGQMAVIFCLVRDRTATAKRRCETSPYCFVRRYGYWRKAYQYATDGMSEATLERSLLVGLVSKNAEEVEDVAGMVYCHDNIYDFSGHTALVTDKLVDFLKLRLARSPDDDAHQLTTLQRVRRVYPTGSGLTEAVWYREDRFAVERMDGSIIAEWVVRKDDDFVVDTFPPLML